MVVDWDKSTKTMTANTIVSHVHRLSPSASEITDSGEKNTYWSVLLRIWKLPSHIKHFPGPNPMSIEKSDAERLQREDFIVALKTDGVRHLLLLTTKPNSTEPIALMIDRTRRMYEIEIWANEDFFYEESLYDGELVWEQNVLVYVVFDAVSVKGISCTNFSYRERIKIIQDTILCVSDHHDEDAIEHMIAEECKFLARNNMNDLRIMPKTCVAKAELHKLWQERALCRHRNDGLIFTMNASPIHTGTSDAILKWKPCHSVDLRFVFEKKAWKMYGNMNNSGDYIELQEACENHTFHLAESKLLNIIQTTHPRIIECILQENEDGTLTLVPERERTDKISPNTAKTIQATIKNVQENINVEDLMKLINSDM